MLSVIGAILITRLINRPLAQLSRAQSRTGQWPRSRAASRDRADRDSHRQRELQPDGRPISASSTPIAPLLLAGISHDLRTPLSRLRLELEMAPLPEATRAAMVGDIEQMDAIVRQFLDYARKAPQAPPPTLI